jgi:hypothetical protein
MKQPVAFWPVLCTESHWSCIQISGLGIGNNTTVIQLQWQHQSGQR